jgi:glycosyltransferase involved in cell wall biosynthesis
MRYAWDQFDAYFGADVVGPVRHWVLKPMMARLARWDAATAGRVDRFVANSQYVAGRIRRYYNRESIVVHPPVDTDFFQPSPARSTAPYFLVVSALVPYKRLDMAIEAARRARVPLKIVGRGPEEARLRQAAGPDVEFTGWLPDEDVRALYQGCTAVVMPGVEDFGMVPVEAQACGRPVVALADGGAVESVVHGETGLLVAEPTADAFADALSDVAGRTFDATAIRRHAESFSRARFEQEFRAVVDDVMSDRSAARMPQGSNAAACAARWPQGNNAAVREDQQ